MPIPGTVQVTGQIAPTDVSDTYPTHNAIYGKGGQRSVADFATRNAISTARRVEGMLVYTDIDGKTWKLLPPPWLGTDADWVEFASGSGVALGGDLSGTAAAATVVGFQGKPVAATVPVSGQSYMFNATANQWQPDFAFHYFANSLAAVAAAPFVDGSYIVLYPGNPTSQAGTYQVVSNGGAAFPADYTKLSDATETASEVGIVDAGGYYAFGPPNVEDALQLIASGQITALPLAPGVGVVDLTTFNPGHWQGGVFHVLLRDSLGTNLLVYETTLVVATNGVSATLTEVNACPGPGVGIPPFTFDAVVSLGLARVQMNLTDANWSFVVRSMSLQAT